MSTLNAAGYPFDTENRRFHVAVPCTLAPLELMALGHALALAESAVAENGVEALRERCAKHQPQVDPALLDRGDWQEVLASSYRAQFDPDGLPAFLGDYGWSLPVGGVRAALEVLGSRIDELYQALRAELQLADLVRERLAAEPAPELPRLDWSGGKPPSEELPPHASPAPALARQISERLNAIAAGVDPRPMPTALTMLEARALSEVTAMMDALREALTPFNSPEELPELIRGLRRLLEEAERLGVGIYLAFG